MTRVIRGSWGAGGRSKLNRLCRLVAIRQIATNLERCPYETESAETTSGHVRHLV